MMGMRVPSVVRTQWRGWLSIVLLLALALPALWPLFTHGYPSTDDGDIHLMRQALLDYHVRHGNWYPRWLPELFLGYGYPLFTFYGPAIYYLSEIFILAGLSIAQALLVTGGLLVLVGGGGMYALAAAYFQDLCDGYSRHAPTWMPTLAGLVAGVAYLYAPYLLTNLYVRGAFAELGAMALWPWVIWSWRRLFTAQAPTHYRFSAGLLLSLMMITHTITLLLVPPVLLLYGLFLLWERRQTGEIGAVLRSCCTAGGIALGLSLFFWLPLISERGELSRLAYSARFMPGHFWDWQTFLDATLRFGYSGHPPHQLGLVQGGLVLLGLFSFWRLGNESRFWLLLGSLLLVAMSRPLEPLWISHDIGLTIQFPWRLLGVISFIFALITGAIITALRWRWLQIGGAALVIGLIIFANQPRTALLDFRQAQDIEVTLDVVATFEKDAQAWGAGWSREFLPKWATAFARVETSSRWEDRQSIFAETKAPAAKSAAPLPQLTLTAATPDQISLTTTAATATQLQLNQLYFPGWQAVDGTGRSLSTLPAPDTGLLTIGLPAGKQRITIQRAATAVERWAGWLTAMTLIGCTLWLFKARRWGQGLLALTLVIVVTSARWLPLAPTPTHFTATTATPFPGLDLVGYRVEADRAGGILLFPYWFVRDQLPDLQLAWQLTDQAGVIVSSTTLQPYYNTVPTSAWSAATLIRDGYRLPLPPALPAGTYQLAVSAHPDDQASDQASDQAANTVPMTVGTVTLTEPAPPLSAQQPLQLAFTLPEQVTVWLDGYTMDIVAQRLDWRRRTALAAYPLAYAGDQLVTRLYWRAAGAAPEGYHSFLHLVDHQRQTLVAQDQLAGSALNSSLTWNRYRPQGETYTLRLPSAATSGLYYPRLGLYTFAEQERFTIFDQAGAEVGDGYDLPPIKVINRQDLQPFQPALVSFGDFARLLAVTVTPANQPLHAGDKIVVELTYQATQATAVDYTQFVHLAQVTPAGIVMAAQFDARPRQGANPTDAWVPGEVITDRLELTLAADATPGRYQLLLGLYDSSGVRAAAVDAKGQEFANQAAILNEIEVN